MGTSYRTVFKQLGHNPVPEGLAQAVFARINQMRARRARYRFVGSLGTTVFSTGGFVWVSSLLADELYQAGFYTYTALLFSDAQIVMLHWRDFLVSLLESAPLFEIMVFFVVTIIYLVLLDQAKRNLLRVFRMA